MSTQPDAPDDRPRADQPPSTQGQGRDGTPTPPPADDPSPADPSRGASPGPPDDHTVGTPPSPGPPDDHTVPTPPPTDDRDHTDPTPPSGPDAPPPPGPGAAWTQPSIGGRRLERRVEDRVVAGVAGGLGDAFGVDAAIFRLAFVALSVFGGGGFVLYLLGWLFMPARGSRTSVGEDLLRRAGGPRSAGGIALIVIALLIIVDSAGGVGGSILWGGLMIGVGVLLFRGDSRVTIPGLTSSSATTAVTRPRQSPSVSAPSVAASPSGGPQASPPLSESPSLAAAPAVDDGWRPRPLPPAPPPPRPPSIVGRATVAATLIAIGALALFDNILSLGLSIATYAAVALVVVGGGLLIGAVVGRARGLIPLGVLALIVLIASSLLAAIPESTSGARLYAPTTVDALQRSYRFGLGELTVDLTNLQLEPGDDRTVDVDLGVGEMLVEVPAEVAVEVDATTRVGAVDAFGRTNGGPGASAQFTEPGEEGAPTISLNLHADMGLITVRRER